MNDEPKTIIAIDLGSRAVKIAIVKGEEPFELFAYDTALFYSEFGEPATDGFRLDMSRFGVSDDAIVRATGYGRNALNIADAEVAPEIQAHVAGAVFQTGLTDFTLVDLGGQDSKIVWVKDGTVDDFFMNDRCAASAGRYLENMANVLRMSLDELSRYWENPEPLSATCAVFGESELVAKLAKGVDRRRLAAGVNAQILRRFAAKLDSNPPGKIVLVGGVAKNGAIAKLLAIRYDIPIIIPEHPQHNACLGLIMH
ncbi:2-hydroxyglutaryl-CoA dehydratase [bacterium]|nr:MAG: 2-hydroxyglutaryl-CoA dehydratase [bacterium]